MGKLNFESKSIPHQVVKAARIIIVVMAVVVFSVVFFVKYPEIIAGEVTVTSQNPPVTIFPKSSGNIESLLKQEGDTVKRGDLICVLGNTTNFQDILNLEIELNNFSSKLDSAHENYWDVFSKSLGALHPFFITFKTSYQDYKYGLKNESTEAIVNSLNAQIDELILVTANLAKIKTIAAQEFELTERQYLRYKELHQKGLYSDAELELNEVNFLKNKRELENINIQINTNNITIEQLKRQRIDLDESKNESLFQKRNKVLGDLQKLQGEITDWKDKNLIYAPIDGIVSMNSIRGDNEYVNSNNAICTIVPIETGSEIVAISTIPMNKTGKLTDSCAVNIKFYNYPYKEFGIVKASIKSIHLLADEGLYTVELNLPHPLVTSYGIEIPYVPEMRGQIEIILEKQSLFEKLQDELDNTIHN